MLMAWKSAGQDFVQAGSIWIAESGESKGVEYELELDVGEYGSTLIIHGEGMASFLTSCLMVELDVGKYGSALMNVRDEGMASSLTSRLIVELDVGK